MNISDYSNENGNRALRLRRKLVQILQRRKCGEEISDDMVIGWYPELMPELGDDLRILSELEEGDSDTKGVLVAGQQVAGGVLSVRCPDCRQQNELSAATPATNINCNSCGSQFSLLEDTSTPNLAGKRLSHFELIERLGAGSFGVVWKAKDTELDRTVAVKIPRGGQLSAAEIERFIREARSAAQLNHRNIVRVCEVGREGETVFIVSELVTGMTLAELPADGQLNFHEAAQLSVEIADALHHAHEAGVIHRDLKPQNIMLDGANQPHLMDFGLARRDAGEITMTMDGRVLGTPAYMSPEQARGEAHQADRRTDIYSLGVILFELLTGELPVRGNARMLIHQVINEDAPSPRKLNSSIPKDLETICMKCLEKEPDRRYDSAKDVAAELRRFLCDEPIHARPISTTHRAWRWCKRNPVVAGLSSLLVVFLLVLGVAGPLVAIKQAGLRHSAEEARRQASERADELARRIYLIHLASADNALRENNYIIAREELDACADNQRGWEWHYLSGRIRATIPRTFPGAEQPIFARSGSQLIAIGSLGTPQQRRACVWDTSSGELVRTFHHNSPLSHLALSPNEKYLAAGDIYGNLFVWHSETGERLWSVRQNAQRFDGIAFNPDGSLIATANWDKTLKVFDAKNGRVQFTIGPLENSLRKVMFSPDGRWISAGVLDGLNPALLVDVERKEIAARFPDDGHTIPTFHPSGSKIASADQNGLITYWGWDGQRLSELRSWQASGKQVLSLDFSADGTRLVSGDAANSVKVWAADREQELASLDAGDFPYWLTIDPDGDLVAFFTISDGIRFWRYGYREQGITIKALDAAAVARFSPDGGRIAVSYSMSMPGGLNRANFSRGQTVILETATRTNVQRLGKNLQSSSWASDGRQLIACEAEQNTIQIYDTASGRQTGNFTGYADVVSAKIVWSRQRLIAVSKDGTIHTWQLKSKESTSFNCDLMQGSITGVGISSNGSFVAVALFPQHQLEIWDVETKKRVCSLDVPEQIVHRIEFSDDGNFIYVSGTGGQLSRLDIDSDEATKRFSGHRSSVLALAISTDEEQIVSGGESGRIVVWDVGSAQSIATLSNGGQPVTSLDWSLDGQRIVAAYADGTIQIWTLPNSS